jgi:hypothetical protein
MTLSEHADGDVFHVGSVSNLIQNVTAMEV